MKKTSCRPIVPRPTGRQRAFELGGIIGGSGSSGFGSAAGAGSSQFASQPLPSAAGSAQRLIVTQELAVKLQTQITVLVKLKKKIEAYKTSKEWQALPR